MPARLSPLRQRRSPCCVLPSRCAATGRRRLPAQRPTLDVGASQALIIGPADGITGGHLPKGGNRMNLKQAVVGILTAGCLIGTAMILPGVSQAQDAKVKAAMELLKSKAAKLGAAKIEGTDKVADKDVPAIYFGSSKQNNNFALVDEVVKEVGGTATIFVKAGDDYVRVATNVPKADGPGGRAIATILDPKGKAIESIKKGEAFYGDVDILGKPYTTGYDPILDASKQVIGIYYVGYAK
jgi:hypothetical protein